MTPEQKKHAASGNENYHENHLPEELARWQEHLQHKELLRKRLSQNYLWLIVFTILFGVVTIGLRLNLRQNWGWGGVLAGWGQDLKSAFEKKQSEEGRESGGPLITELAGQTSEKLLQGLRGQTLPSSALEAWGEYRELAGSNEELALLYFPENKVYLLRKRSDATVVYAGTRKP